MVPRIAPGGTGVRVRMSPSYYYPTAAPVAGKVYPRAACRVNTRAFLEEFVVTACRMVVSNENHQDVLTFRCVSRSMDDSVRKAIEATIRDLCKLRASVEFVNKTDLPNDGKVIEDARSYE